MNPPDNAIYIGEGHRILYADYKGEVAGINEYHLKADSTWCSGWIVFKGSAWDKEFSTPITNWDVVQREPLTLSPSILCHTCGSHGYIRDGRWVPA